MTVVCISGFILVAWVRSDLHSYNWIGYSSQEHIRKGILWTEVIITRDGYPFSSKLQPSHYHLNRQRNTLFGVHRWKLVSDLFESAPAIDVLEIGEYFLGAFYSRAQDESP
jgi:hypothetical protein